MVRRVLFLFLPLCFAVEAVEKPVFRGDTDKEMARVFAPFLFFSFDRFVLVRIALMSPRVVLRSFSFPSSLLVHPIPVMRQFLDVMNKAEEFPLRIDLLLAAQREAIEPFVVSDVSEHWFNGGETSPVQGPTFRAVDRPFHEIGVAHLR